MSTLDTKKDKILETVFMFCVLIFSMMAIIPFWIVFINSFTSELSLIQNGYSLFPKVFSIDAYKLVFMGKLIPNAYKVSLFTIVVGTFLSLVFTSIGAYGLSCKSVKYRNHISFFVYLTMLFNVSLVPYYLLISKYLHLRDSLWVLIIPAIINPFNLFLLRNFFSSVPESISESARIDGASELRILFSIILPISVPGLATVGLFYALSYWSEWFRALLFISDDKKYPLQYLIISMLRNLSDVTRDSQEAQMGFILAPANTTRLATVIVTIGPIIFIYPFIQRYFIKGITIGSVKG